MVLESGDGRFPWLPIKGAVLAKRPRMSVVWKRIRSDGHGPNRSTSSL